MLSIHKLKKLLAKMKVSVLLILFLANFEPKPLATKLVKKLVIWSMQTGPTLMQMENGLIS